MVSVKMYEVCFTMSNFAHKSYFTYSTTWYILLVFYTKAVLFPEIFKFLRLGISSHNLFLKFPF